MVRRILCRLPAPILNTVTLLIAALVYWPISRLAPLAQRCGVKNWPLSSYADKSFYVLATDSRDRFGTRLEQQFSRASIQTMMEAAGLEAIRFSDEEPYWVSLGYRISN